MGWPPRTEGRVFDKIKRGKNDLCFTLFVCTNRLYALCGFLHEILTVDEIKEIKS